MQLVSQCALSVGKLLWRPSHGGYAFTVVCKATFEIEPNLSPLAHEQEPIFETNAWAENGSLLRASDFVPSKKRAEVLLVGDAHAPGGRPVTSLVTRVVVGTVDKSILVIGDRYVTADGRVGEAASFVRMPLVWERAVATAENPVGKQFGSGNRPTSPSSEWSLAPNLYPVAFEWPRPGMPIAPMAYAPISPGWPSRHGRLQQAATNWDVHRWNERPLPGDFDFAYMNAAPTDQHRTAPFADDAIYLENLHPDLPRLSTRLEVVTPTATVDQGAGPQPLNLRCDTLLINTNRSLATLVWRGHVVVDHPDRPGRIVVTTQKPHTASARAPEVPEMEAEAVTMIPGVQPALRSTVLPFKSTSAAPTASPSAPKINIDTTDFPDDSDGTHTLVPAAPGSRDRAEFAADSDGTHTLLHDAPSVKGSALPFVGGLSEPRPTRGDSLPFKSSPTSPGLSTWKPLGSDGRAESPATAPLPFASPSAPPAFPAPPPVRPAMGSSPDFPPPPPMRPAMGSSPDFPPPPPMRPAMGSTPLMGSALGLGTAGVLAPAPAQAAPAAMTAPAKPPETKNASPEEDLENRLRLVQRAIWKGDRPIEQILTAHGFTELEWRAAKRASVRKSPV